ncbi:unnamed protein product [Lathyrus sativus]|nr:unnamed protein product [Lathyrus sativus]
MHVLTVMGKTSKWFRNLLKGKKDREKEKEDYRNGTENPTTPISATPKEKRRWSFRRSSASKEVHVAESSVASSVPLQTVMDSQSYQRKHVMEVAAADGVIFLNSCSNGGTRRSIEVASAIKIQSVFRSYLARKALCALRGIVKLQALVRGHLVRKQATETLRCMQALVLVQARACAQRARMLSEDKANQKHATYRKAAEDRLFMHMYNEMERGLEENIKTVEMDVCESKGNLRNRNNTTNHEHHGFSEHRLSAYYSPNGSYSKKESYKVSPTPSARTDSSPKACSGYFEDGSFSTAQNSPYYYSAVSRADDSKLPFSFTRQSYEESMFNEYPLFPNYMANTESSRAKVRSQSAPKQRPDSSERQPSRRRASVEGRNVPRPVRMLRSSSHVGATAQNYQYPWSIKLDRSSASLDDNECESTSTVLTNSNYCRSLVSYNPHGPSY